MILIRLNLTLMARKHVINMLLQMLLIKYFVQVGPRLAKKIKNTTDPLTYVTPAVNSIFIPYVSENEITEVILSLKNSSAGHASILASIAKPLIQYYIKPLTCLINSSFENGLFHDELKIAKVIPIF